MNTALWDTSRARRISCVMSTGLTVNGDDAGERGALVKKSFSVLILDEAQGTCLSGAERARRSRAELAAALYARGRRRRRT